MNQLIVGFGEIGKAVKEAICPDAETYDLKDEVAPIPENIDVLHICFPYSKTFRDEVKSYIRVCKPKHVIVYSTVPIGTCRSISDRVVHSFVEGTHPNLATSISDSRRWIGASLGLEARFFVDYFLGLGFSTIYVPTETTELAKLRSTAKYGINLVWAQYESELCEKFGVQYEDIMQFDSDYNDTYKNDSYVGRYVLYPPNGKIGGHCVVPNAKLLNEQFPSDLLQRIIDMEVK